MLLLSEGMILMEAQESGRMMSLLGLRGTATL